MLTTNVKQQINTARDILVGKIPDPKGQIDQITNALIYKFMDDQDRLALTLPNGKPSFFVNELKPYAWHKLFDTKLSNQDKANLYVEGITKLSVCKHLPDLFQDIFKDAYLPFRAPDTIAMFLNEINKFDYHHSEDLGNAFEYLLSIMGSQGDAGQFRTPRNIIEFIVDAVDPSKDDHILDPACGTAGFLVEAYKHITKDKKLTPNEVQELAKHIHGVDIDPGMAKIARVNLYLHGFKTPLITEDDTLSDEKIWGKKYDVILANPPFMTPKGGIVPHDKFSVKSNRAEVLFTDYIAEHLKLAGRAGIVVPEGIIFQSGKVYKQLRKMLVDDNYLWAVVSLPAGVFNPYSGVKTTILLLDRERATKNKEILFFKVENDGFDLGAQRRENSKNDLPEALEAVKKWKNGEKIENSMAIYIEKSRIAESGDYNLSGDRYRVAVDYSNAKWPMVELGDVCNLESGSRDKGGAVDRGVYSIGGEQISADNEIRFGKMKHITEKHFSEMKKGILLKGDVLMVKDGATTGKMGFWNYDYRAAVNEHVFIFRAKDQILVKYLFNVLLSDSFQYELKPYIKGIIGGISLEVKKIKIPLPPLEIQEQVVAELDGYAGIIAGAKQIAQNWKPKIEIDSEWEKVKLGEVCETSSGGTPLKSKTEFYENGTIPWLRSGEVAQGFVRESELFITEAGLKNSSAKIFPVDTVLVAMYGATAGQVGILKFESATNQAVCGILPNKELVPEFLFQALKDQKEIMVQQAGGGAQPNISQGVVRNLEIPLPSLAIQKKIVEKIEAERALVESSKKLIEIYEQKTKEVVAKLWEE